MRTLFALMLISLLALVAACGTDDDAADGVTDDAIDAPGAVDDAAEDDMVTEEDDHDMADDAAMDDHDMADDAAMDDHDMTDDAAMDDHDMAMGDMDDETFLAAMIDHHIGAVDMAEIALEEAERDELIQLAQEIIDAQEEEIDLMQQWLDEWYDGGPDDHGISHEEMGMEMDMDEFREAEPFDLAFIDEMIVHHEGAIDMSQAILGTTEREEVRELAEEIIEAQEAEIEQMQQWRSEWFND